MHIEFRNWADLLVVAPLDANTLAKFAMGLCDNFLTCLFRAWDFARPVILAPAMNTLMWQSPVTARHLGQLLLDHGGLTTLPEGWSLETAPDHFARHAPGLILVPPQSKRLACGDIGMGAMAEVATIAEVVRAGPRIWLSQDDRFPRGSISVPAWRGVQDLFDLRFQRPTAGSSRRDLLYPRLGDQGPSTLARSAA